MALLAEMRKLRSKVDPTSVTMSVKARLTQISTLQTLSNEPEWIGTWILIGRSRFLRERRRW